MKLFFLIFSAFVFNTQANNKQNLPNKLNEIWKEKINLSLNKNTSIKEVLKNLAAEFNIKINIHTNNLNNIQYEANEKEIIEILIDICEILNLKLTIKNNNAKITDDEIYLVNYDLAYLSLNRSFESNTKANITFDKEKSNTNLNTKFQTDFFEELKKNLENLFQEQNIKFIINKQAGIISFFATQKQHKTIIKYLNKLNNNMQEQVEIDGKIYEVELHDENEIGINFEHLKKQLQKCFNIQNYFENSLKSIVFSDKKNNSNGKTDASTQTEQTSFENKNNNSSSPIASSPLDLIDALGKYGKVKTVGNPKMLLSNNNLNIFKSVDNKVFFKLKKDSIFFSDLGNNKTNKNQNAFPSSVSSEMQTVAAGINLCMQSISTDDEKICILFKIMITDINSHKVDPIFKDFKVDKEYMSVPEVSVKEMDSMFSIKNNEQIIIGGLKYSNVKEESNNIPFTSIPIWKKKITKNKEIVISLTGRKQKIGINLNPYSYLFE